jgi:hypothetical protein
MRGLYMLAQRPKLFTTVFLFLGGFIGILFGCTLAFFTGKTLPIEKSITPVTPPPNLAIRTITVTIDPKLKDELFARLENFADEWRYAVLIAPTNSSENKYIVKLYRIDMKMTGSYDTDTGVLELGFYNTRAVGQNPERYFDDELKDLKSLIGEIPNSTYVIKK